jgi:hypothetical protein
MRAFVVREVLDREPAILRAAGDDDGVRLDLVASLETEHETAHPGIGTVFQNIDFFGNREFRAEFLRLVVGARCQRQAADTGRKPQIIFDSCGSAGLTAKCATIENDNRESLGCGIDRCRKTCRTGADDSDVIDLGTVDTNR